MLADTEFAHELDSILKTGPVYTRLGMKIMSTTEVEDKVKGIDSGADDFVTKPFNKLEKCIPIHVLRDIVQLHE